MKTKLTYLLLCLSNLFAVCTYAQKVRTGFLGGANYTLPKYDFSGNLIFEGPRSTWDASPDLGFFGGFEIEYDFTDKLFVSSGLFLNNSQFKVSRVDSSFSGQADSYKYQFSVFDFKLPLMLNYRAGKFSVGLGAFANYSIAGNVKTTYYGNQSTIEKPTQALAFDNKNEEAFYFKPLNAGLSAEAGFGVKRWRTAVHFDLGLLNLNNKRDFYYGLPNFPSKRSALSLSFLYHPWPR